MILHIVDLKCEVPGRTLFSGLSLDAGAGEAVAVVGPSGSGKSTLLSVILGMTRPAGGTVHVDGRDMTSASVSQAARTRRERIGVVFQSGELLPELTAAENVAVALMMMKPSAEPAIDAARALLRRYRVPPDTLTADLSGGERQRTALCRALSTDPMLVLADEPTGSLDAATRDMIAGDLFGAARARGAALLVVTHDPEVARRADRTIDLADYI